MLGSCLIEANLPINVDKAIALVKKTKDQVIQRDMYTYNILIVGLCKEGRLKNAHQNFSGSFD
jgi:pentatricopeptide repeat domain-containing protein 1